MPKNRRRGWRPDRILGMGNSDTLGEDGPGTGPPLTPEQFVKAMDVLASYEGYQKLSSASFRGSPSNC
jgi:hypothetical protein